MAVETCTLLKLRSALLYCVAHIGLPSPRNVPLYRLVLVLHIAHAIPLRHVFSARKRLAMPAMKLLDAGIVTM
jgi:hypothetical protein